MSFSLSPADNLETHGELLRILEQRRIPREWVSDYLVLGSPGCSHLWFVGCAFRNISLILG